MKDRPIKWDFEQEVNKMHKIEVQSLHKELQEKNEPYYKQISDEGYNNLHDYEKDVTEGLMKRILLLSGIILFALIGCIIAFL